jgi:hypothetical protein
MAVAVAVAAGVLAVSGGSRSDPRTPPALPGLPPPFLGTAVIGSGAGTAAVDSYGNIVDLRSPGPAGPASVEVPAESQAAGSVEPGDAIVARASIGAGGRMPLWRADSIEQRYLPGTNVLCTVARFGERTSAIERMLGGPMTARADRRWIARARPLGPGAPAWAHRLHQRSLLVLRALTDRRTGAVAAGARDGWAHVWPRDAAAVAIALASAGYLPESRRVVRFLLRLDLDAAARFDGRGAPVEGRPAQGDAAGWVAAAARAAGRAYAAGAGSAHAADAGGAGAPDVAQRLLSDSDRDWHDLADYQEKEPGDYLANGLASAAFAFSDAQRPLQRTRFGGMAEFVTDRGLVRSAEEPDSGLDSAAAWAVRPFPRPELFGAARRTLLRLAAAGGRYGIVPSEDWPEQDPWTAPTAWSAWSLAALAGSARRNDHPVAARRDRRAALSLMAALRRAATPLGMLPERVDADTGLPRSTTPLAWSHAFAILAVRELWPGPMLAPHAGSGSNHR